MIIAQQKKKENLCEYLLYMWQVEDMLRAANCQESRIEEMILPRYNLPSDELAPIRQWYLELAEMMRTEGKMDSGHLDINRIVLMQLEELHRELLANPDDILYQGLHYQVLPLVIQLKSKQSSLPASDLELCFNAVYGYLVLTLKGEKISQETTKAIKLISSFLATLALKYQLRLKAEQEDK